MKNPHCSSLIAILCVLSFTVSPANASKVPEYQCTFGNEDDAYSFDVLDFNPINQDVTVTHRSKLHPSAEFTVRVKRVADGDDASTYYGAKDGLSVTMIRSPQRSGELKTSSFGFTDSSGAHELLAASCETRH